ncbi:winged helix-turn-helix transcriptional regulator [Herbaspirillum sp. LeCh32-8]|uniref:MarR family winged helix-turn-helix transcriptional regulator n=1 Tax=Herbaspirillum sp. LeCh32-8 TaxID=2821356 RepID=UPI001AE30C4F|nr:MarR family winged helix-turn-helix transcriptional regulator [Herbaspirillum sp. LeCh32-8]MBP0599676.1 winged helix-turn-helix transcriptional regulator [Herbaspirillum sp. LeCh32-8]
MTSNKKPLHASPLESHLGFWLRFVSNHVSARFAALVEEQGITVSEWVALRHLFDSDGAAAGELVDTLGMTKGAVSKLVGRLEEKQLLARAASPEDGRAQTLALTAQGRKLVPALAELADKNDALFFGHLPAEKREELIAILREITQRHQLRALPTE